MTLLYYNTIWPFDEKILLEHFNQKIIICEPFYQGTTNHIITHTLRDRLYSITNIGIPRKFLYNYGSKQEHDEYLGLDTLGIKKKIQLCLI